jgi:hypothetical protein
VIVYVSDEPSFIRSYITPSKGITVDSKGDTSLSADATILRIIKCPYKQFKGHVAFQLAEDQRKHLTVIGKAVSTHSLTTCGY